MANPLITGRDLQSLVQSVAAVPSTSITSNAAGTYSAVTGLTIDRATIQSNGGIAQQITNAMPLGCLFILQYDLSIAAAKSFGATSVKVEHSNNGTAWASLYDINNTTTVSPPSTWPTAAQALLIETNAGTAAATIHGSVMFEADVKSANRYIRLDVTPTLTSTGTIDTASFYGVAVLHGFSEVLPTQL